MDLDLPFMSGELRQLFAVMRDTTNALDAYHRDYGSAKRLDADGRADDSIFVAIADDRIGIQHHLLHLTWSKSAEHVTKHPLHQICCIALLLYSDMVLFATPIESGVRKTLAIHLLGLLSTDTNMLTYSEIRFLEWVVVLGSVAAHTSGLLSEERAYGHIIRRDFASLLTASEESLAVRLGRYLWWSVVHNQPARVVLLAARSESESE